MREVNLVTTSRTRRRLRSHLADILARMTPTWVFRMMMQHRFINFGVETTNICNANCSFCGWDPSRIAETIRLLPGAIEEVANQSASVNEGLATLTVDLHLMDPVEQILAQREEAIVSVART